MSNSKDNSTEEKIARILGWTKYDQPEDYEMTPFGGMWVESNGKVSHSQKQMEALLVLVDDEVGFALSGPMASPSKGLKKLAKDLSSPALPENDNTTGSKASYSQSTLRQFTSPLPNRLCKCGHEVFSHDLYDSHQCNHCSCQLLDEATPVNNTSFSSVPENDKKLDEILDLAGFQIFPSGANEMRLKAKAEILKLLEEARRWEV